MLRFICLSLALVCAMTFWLTPRVAMAQSLQGLEEAVILPGWRIAPDTHFAAVKIALAPGWVTYWRAPGDGGIPPQITVTPNSAIAGITPEWPSPQIIDSAGMRAVGYPGGVILPLRITTKTTGPIPLELTLFIGICHEVCIPVTLTLSAVLPASPAPDPRIQAARAQGPLAANEAQVSATTCRVQPAADGLSLTAHIAVPPLGTDEHVVIEMPDPDVWVSAATVTRTGAVLEATVDLVPLSGGALALDRSALRLTLLGGPRAIEITGCAAG